MRQIHPFSDDRQWRPCAYCGRSADSRDHVPSRVFLDEPFPENLPVVNACRRCNESFSLDEQYVACLVECAACGTTEPQRLTRPKVRRLLREIPSLRSRLKDARLEIDGETTFAAEADRVANVVVKLARGHSVFELNEAHYEPPIHMSFHPLPLLSAGERASFEEAPATHVFPEVGSRMMQRMAEGEFDKIGWLEPQAGRYRYLAVATDTVVIRAVINDYLAAEVVWG